MWLKSLIYVLRCRVASKFTNYAKLYDFVLKGFYLGFVYLHHGEKSLEIRA